MENSSRFFENTGCKYFPCHKLEGDFNCLFCYCPLYFLDNCPGNHTWIERDGYRIKNCIDCVWPHKPENYDIMMTILKNKCRKN
ncbi:Cysteine-rich small domain-containing protein [Lachnospiraceae bacterium KH1T2]|nr:Cysteine-rich small domain-containing protein [Lachnospiraceae bacterium KH1T2]